MEAIDQAAEGGEERDWDGLDETDLGDYGVGVAPEEDYDGSSEIDDQPDYVDDSHRDRPATAPPDMPYALRHKQRPGEEERDGSEDRYPQDTPLGANRAVSPWAEPRVERVRPWPFDRTGDIAVQPANADRQAIAVPREARELAARIRATAAAAAERGRAMNYGEQLSSDASGKVNIIGGADAAREVAVFHATLPVLRGVRTEQLSGERRTDATVVVVNYNPADRPSFFSLAEVPDLYDVRSSTPAAPDGVVNKLQSHELADALARAAAGDDEAAYRTYVRVLDPLAEAVGEEIYDPQQRRVVVAAPDLNTLSRAIDQARRGPRVLPPDKERRVDLALDKAQKEGPALEQVAAYVGDLVRKTTQAPQHGYTPRYEPPKAKRFGDQVPRLTVDEINIPPGDTSGAAFVPHALVHAIRSTRPAAVAFQNVDEGDPSIQSAVRECQRLGIWVCLSAGRITEEWVARLVGSGAHGILTPAASDARLISEQVLGVRDGVEVNSVSVNVGANRGSSANKSRSENYEASSPIASSSGTSGARDRSAGHQVGKSQNAAIGDISVARAGQLREIGPEAIAVFGSNGRAHGLHNVNTLAPLGSFPPPSPDLYNVDPYLAQVALQHDITLPGVKVTEDDRRRAIAAALAEAAQPPSGDQRDRIALPGPAQSDLLASMNPRARAQELRIRHGYGTSFAFGQHGISASFSAALDAEAARRGMDPAEFRRWAGLA